MKRLRTDLGKNISYTLVANVLSVAVAAAITFIVPKFIGVRSYGLFQLYIFYSSYIGFLHFGWADGFYLRYGGEYYDKLDKPRVSGQFWAMTAVELLFTVMMLAAGLTLVPDHEKSTVVALTACTIVIVLPRTLLQYVLQCTNRIKEYSVTVVTERLIYFLLVVCCIALSAQSFSWYIMADVAGKIVALAVTCWYCMDAVLCRPEPLEDIVSEARINISVGIKLMLSNVASMLIIGIVRYAIEAHWDVETFGKISLTLSVSNLLLVMINAVALVMYPALRRTSEDRYAEIYVRMRTMLMTPVLGMLIFYYPLKVILSAWLPAYSDSLTYMAILFPVCVFESKNSMLIVTFFKTMRKEKLLLLVNSLTVALSVLLTYITVFVLDDLDLAVLSIVVLVAFRNVISEVIISRTLNVELIRPMIEELVLTACFIVSSWSVGGIKGLCIYCLCYAVYCIINRKDLAVLVKTAVSRRDSRK